MTHEASLCDVAELAGRVGLPYTWLEREALNGRLPSEVDSRGVRRFDEHAVRMALVNHFALGRGDLSVRGLLLTREQLAKALNLPTGLIDRLREDGVLTAVSLPENPHRRYNLLDALDALRQRFGTCVASAKHRPRRLVTLRQFAGMHWIKLEGLEALRSMGRLPHFEHAGRVLIDEDFAGRYLNWLNSRYPVLWSGAGAAWAKAIDEKIRANDPAPKKPKRAARKNFLKAPGRGRPTIPPIDAEADDPATPSDGRGE